MWSAGRAAGFGGTETWCTTVRVFASPTAAPRTRPAPTQHRRRDMNARRVLVTGASGLIGRYAVRAFLRDGWDVYGMSRKAPELAHERYCHLSVDLREAPAVMTALERCPPITNLAYTAVYEK